MKKFLSFLLGILVIAGIVYVVPTFRAKAQQLLSYNQCNYPLAYKIGSIDSRFGLTNQDIVADIGQATGIWNSAEGKNLFINSDKADLTVNFVYDQRQALDSTIQQLNTQLNQNNSTLTQQINQFKIDEAAYQQKLDAFNATVEKYNREGGAPPDVYQQLLQEQQQLNAEGQALNARAQQLNLSTTQYNQNVTTLNTDVYKYRNVLSQKPEEGVYDGITNTITIYIVDSKQELLHTLSHEFGHALGMGHVADQNAIMYPYTTDSLSVTPDDLKQLAYVCREQSAIIHSLQVIDIWLYTRLQPLRQALLRQ